MSQKHKKFKNDLNQLIQLGNKLFMAMQYDCHPDEVKDNLLNVQKMTLDKVNKYIEELPDFYSEYQSWYSEALSLVAKVLPNRLEDFVNYYEFPKVRKETTFANYMIKDYLQGLHITRGYQKDVVVDGSAAVPEFRQQLNIVKAAEDVLESSLLEMTSILQADLFDSEIGSAKSLAKAGHLRAAGAVSGCLLYTSPSPRDRQKSRMPSSA